MTGNNYTKESIKNRMFRRMAALWDVRNVETVDPVVKLLIEALAGEIFRLSGEMDTLETRILEKIAAALTPGNLLSAHPAHAIMHVRAKEKAEKKIERTGKFIYKDAAIGRKYQLKRLEFHPLQPVTVIDGAVRYMISSGEVHTLDPKTGKDYVARATRPDMLFNHTLWLGLELGEDVSNLQELAFYFDLSQVEEMSAYLSLLPHTRWTIGGKEVRMRKGFPVATGPGTTTGDIRNESPVSPTALSVGGCYDESFLTVDEPVSTGQLAKEPFPGKIAHLFPADYIQSFSEPLVWIEIELPAFFREDIVRQLGVYINAFPVANMYRRDLISELSPTTSVVPLGKEDAEFFLSVESVSDSEGKKYAELEGPDPEKYDGGTYALRRGGSERFSSYDAREYILRLTDLLYDESVAFSQIDKDSLQQNMDELLRQIDLLAQRAAQAGKAREGLSYLLVERKERNHNYIKLFVDYWLTNGDIANSIPATTPFSFPGEDDVWSDSICLLSTTRGGQEPPATSRKMDLFRYALVSHGPVYTHADIVSFCKAHYGEYISDITVALGYAPAPGPRHGMVRTLDVRIRPSGACNGINTITLENDIRTQLAAHSPETYNYRVLIQ